MCSVYASVTLRGSGNGEAALSLSYFLFGWYKGALLRKLNPLVFFEDRDEFLFIEHFEIRIQLGGKIPHKLWTSNTLYSSN